MKVVLTADVAALGNRGEIVDVSDGYARNYLLPRDLAQKATSGAVASAAKAAASRAATERKALEAAQDLATALSGQRVVLAAQAGDEGRLYGSVTLADVAEGIRKFTGISIDRRHIELPQPIKTIGLHEVQIRLHPEVEFSINVDVIPV
ncbi:MAG TPA: 50S ribosomal protein L9 [Acidimicrobiia bacterium]|nr:50S ribosomal protein L9 [Acidimicrobiia bacterium]